MQAQKRNTEMLSVANGDGRASVEMARGSGEGGKTGVKREGIHVIFTFSFRDAATGGEAGKGLGPRCLVVALRSRMATQRRRPPLPISVLPHTRAEDTRIQQPAGRKQAEPADSGTAIQVHW